MEILKKKLKSLQDYNIYGDLAGRATEFFQLQKRLGGRAFSVGDICDRGPNTKELFDYFMTDGKVVAGNHDFLMYDWLVKGEYYKNWYFLVNNSGPTLKSFLPPEKHLELDQLLFQINDNFSLIKNSDESKDQLSRDNQKLSDHLYDLVTSYLDKSYIEFLGSLPLFYEDQDVIISHASLRNHNDLKNLPPTLQACQGDWNKTVLWHRGQPGIKSKIHIFGHLGLEKPKVFLNSQDRPYALCLDGSRGKKLWCYKASEDKLFFEEYL